MEASLSIDARKFRTSLIDEASTFNELVRRRLLSDWLSIADLMGEGFMGGGWCTPPFTIFLFLTSFFKIEKDFLPVLSKLSQASMVKIFIFQMSGRWFPWHPKGGGCTPPHKSRGVFYTHIGHGN